MISESLIAMGISGTDRAPPFEKAPLTPIVWMMTMKAMLMGCPLWAGGSVSFETLQSGYPRFGSLVRLHSQTNFFEVSLDWAEFSTDSEQKMCVAAASTVNAVGVVLVVAASTVNAVGVVLVVAVIVSAVVGYCFCCWFSLLIRVGFAFVLFLFLSRCFLLQEPKNPGYRNPWNWKSRKLKNSHNCDAFGHELHERR